MPFCQNCGKELVDGEVCSCATPVMKKKGKKYRLLLIFVLVLVLGMCCKITNKSTLNGNPGSKLIDITKSSFAGKVSMSQIERDIPQEIREILIDSEKILLDVDSIEVEKRSTEEIYDDIYCNIVMSNKDYQVTAVYVCEYKNYSEGGWILENSWLSDASIICLSEMPSQIEFALKNSIFFLNGDTFDVQKVDSKRISDNCFEFQYDVEMEKTYNKYLIREGVYKLRYNLVKSSNNCYLWESQEDATGIVTVWDIVGTYECEEAKKHCKLVIDSYNPETKEVHIVSYYYESDGWEYVKCSEKNDLTLIAEEGESKADGLYLYFGFETSVYGMIGTHYEYQNIIFDGNEARVEGTLVERID